MMVSRAGGLFPSQLRGKIFKILTSTDGPQHQVTAEWCTALQRRPNLDAAVMTPREVDEIATKSLIFNNKSPRTGPAEGPGASYLSPRRDFSPRVKFDTATSPPRLKSSDYTPSQRLLTGKLALMHDISSSPTARDITEIQAGGSVNQKIRPWPTSPRSAPFDPPRYTAKPMPIRGGLPWGRMPPTAMAMSPSRYSHSEENTIGSRTGQSAVSAVNALQENSQQLK